MSIDRRSPGLVFAKRLSMGLDQNFTDMLERGHRPNYAIIN